MIKESHAFSPRSYEQCSNLCKIKLVAAGRLVAVLDMSPSTTIKGAALFTAPSTSTLLWGPVSAPN